MDALIGKKVGMTQVFDEAGRQIPVTVLELGPCPVVQRKTVETDGYDAVQIGYGEKKAKRLTKPLQGHFKKAGADTQQALREVRVGADEEFEPGSTLNVSIFDGVTFVDVTATTKGRGFQGVVKRYNMRGGRASHGGGNLRGPGSIGMCEFPGRVFKGKKLPGHMGSVQVTVQHLKVVAVREEDNALLVRGAVPGPNGGLVMVRKSLKKAAKAS